MNQDHALNWNAGAAQVTPIILAAPANGAQPTVNVALRAVAAVAAGAMTFVCTTYPTTTMACVCPSCGKAH